MDLPKVFQNRNIGVINNDQEYFYSSSSKTQNNVQSKKINVEEKINKIFNSNKFVYKIKVLINTKEEEINTTIIGKVNHNLITINNELIPIKDILDINEK
ncbi:MAG: hypothetical protein J1F35_04585 [Erysipelotrichales bacterium]|nr:hypothetical protein [Erysipelotrichales bacterium]